MRIASPTSDLLGTSPLATFINSNNLSGLPKATPDKLPSNNSGPTDVSSIEMRQQPLHHLLRMTDTQTPEKPALMAPTMFAATTSSTNPNVLFKPTTTIEPQATLPTVQSSTSSSFNHTHHVSSEVATQSRNQPEPLTQSQLLQAMNYLIKNDPDFVRKLHEAYLKSFTEMVSL